MKYQADTVPMRRMYSYSILQCKRLWTEPWLTERNVLTLCLYPVIKAI